MRTLILSLILIAGYTVTYAQTDSIRVWNKYCSKADSPLLFIGSYNEIQIYCQTRKPGDLKIKCLDNTLKTSTPEIKGDTLCMMAMPYATEGKKMRLAIMDKKTQKVLKTVYFSRDNVPAPAAQFGKLPGTEGPRKNLLEQTAVKVIFPNSLYCYPYTVKQYIFKMKHAKTDITRPVLGNHIPVDILTEIKNAPDGTFFELTDIKAIAPECAMHTLPNLKIKIK